MSAPDATTKVDICKDYFTVRQAATYAGVSYSHWRARIQPEFPPGEFFGRLIYRRADVQRFLEEKARWPQSIGVGTPRTSTGPRAVISTDGPSVGSRRMMREGKLKNVSTRRNALAGPPPPDDAEPGSDVADSWGRALDEARERAGREKGHYPFGRRR